MNNQIDETYWRPATDVFDDEKEIIVHVDLPGIPKEEISIDVDPAQVTIHGERKGVEGFESATNRVRERGIGKFRKIVRLPTGCDVDNIQSKYKDGLLELKASVISFY